MRLFSASVWVQPNFHFACSTNRSNIRRTKFIVLHCEKPQSIDLYLIILGYRLSDRFYDLLIKKFDRTGRGTVAFDDFIQACVSIHTLTNAFRQFDHAKNGEITIGYEDFLHLVFSLKM